MSRLPGKVALITGAASGIGRATAQAFAEAGARVILADIDEAGGAKAAAELREQGHTADYLQVDLTSPGSIESFTSRVLQRFGAPDVIVNGAGWGKTHPFWEGTPDLWDKVIALNFVGPMRLVKALLPAISSGAAAASSTSPATPGASAAWAKRCIPAPRAA